MHDLVLQQSHEATPDGLKLLLLLHSHRPHAIRPDEKNQTRDRSQLTVWYLVAKSYKPKVKSSLAYLDDQLLNGNVLS